MATSGEEFADGCVDMREAAQPAPRVFFLARGRGRAQARRTMEIVAAVEALGARAKFTLISYGAGAEALKSGSNDWRDLGIPETSSMWAILVAAGRLLDKERPDLVVCCDEFVILPLAHMLSIPAVFVGEWFTDPRSPIMLTLAHTDEVIFTGDPGIFQEPPYLKGKVFYSGPLLRKFSYSARDRERARRDLRIPQDATVAAVLPGDWATEATEPILHVLVPAFESLPAPGKLMIWVAGRDRAAVEERIGGRPNVIVKKDDSELDQIMVASDFAVTKGNSTAIRELSALGIPSISISHGRSPVDDIYSRRIASNRFLEASLLGPAELEACMKECLVRAETPRQAPASLPVPTSAGLAAAARRISEHIQRVEGGRRAQSAVP